MQAAFDDPANTAELKAGRRKEAHDELRAQLHAAQRLASVLEARQSLLKFCEVTMPDPTRMEDPTATLFESPKHVRVMIAALEKVERYEWPRLIITLPPRHGKSETVSRKFPAYSIGRDPTRQIIFATYNDDFAKDFGRDVREIVRMPVYADIFPRAGLRKGGSRAEGMDFTAGGKMFFVGRGGALTGKGGHIMIVDDPFKDASEADSAAIRDTAWNWFTKVFMTRRMNVYGIVIVMTRWHEDDIVGRLTDPQNPNYDEDEARTWKIINLPFFAEDGDPMGRPVGEALWPSRYPKEFGEAQRRIDPRGFSALYQQRPSPVDGTLFKRDDLEAGFYSPDERPPPEKLRIFAVSDHAVATKQENDRTCLIPFGVDQDDDIWFFPDVFWQRSAPEETVRAMVAIMKARKPVQWWAEKGHISKALGPFLRRRMQEESAFTAVIEVTPAGDKVQRASSFIGRVQMRKVHFPRNAWWVSNAMEELMKFPRGRFDDFVDACSIVGLGLDTMRGTAGRKPRETYRPGTIGWIKEQTRRQEARRASHNGLGGW